MTQTENPVKESAPQESVETVVAALDGWFQQLRRHVGGFSVLFDGYLAATGQEATGPRRRGLPIFEYPVGLPAKDRIESTKDYIDLRDVDAAHLAHVLAPLVNVKARQLVDALAGIDSQLEVLRPLLDDMVGLRTAHIHAAKTA